MVLSKREKYIVIGVGAAVGLLVLDQSVLTPYADKLQHLDDQTQAARQANADLADLFTRQHGLRKVWAELTGGGLSADASRAESQALNAVLDWSGEAGVNLTALKPDRPSTERGFDVISFHATATGSTPAVAKLMWDIETATIPVRLTDVVVTPRKEGTDDLTIQFGVTTLCLHTAPPADPIAPGLTSATNYPGGGQ